MAVAARSGLAVSLGNMYLITRYRERIASRDAVGGMLTFAHDSGAAKWITPGRNHRVGHFLFIDRDDASPV